jgi:integrase
MKRRDPKAIANRVRIDRKRAKLHSFRRTGTKRLLQKGLSLQEVMALGGWKDIVSVQRYMGLLNHDRLTAVEAAWA